MVDDAPGVPVERFPRGSALPRQTPLYWVAEKDRYLRQLLIGDIEKQTERRLIVYFADCDNPEPGALIQASDDAYLAELLGTQAPCPTDLMLETGGGSTDATEKLVGMLKERAPDLRVIIPCRAKSNGTLLALAAGQIVMGYTSELGPIDPLLYLGPETGLVPAHLLLNSHESGLVPQVASEAIEQTKGLATTLLKDGMFSGRPDDEIARTVDLLAGRDQYHSHGSVIDAGEAEALGLSVHRLPADDTLWQAIWLLRCMYVHDLREKGLLKIFEGRVASNALKASKTAGEGGAHIA